MTTVTFASVKGAPGVTTLACLVGATWPAGRRVLLAECDPSGGDLAARFRLSSRTGWPSLTAAARRSASEVALEPHIQRLPGGLEVLVGAGVGVSTIRPVDRERARAALLSWMASGSEGPRDLLVDVGRLMPGDDRSDAWLDVSDRIVVFLGGDGASVMQVALRVGSDLSRWRERLALVVLGTDGYSGTAIERFAGIPVMSELPFDPRSASVVAGARSGDRRLSRSLLTARAGRLAAALVPPALAEEDGDPGECHDDDSGARSAREGVPERLSVRRRLVTHLRRRTSRKTVDGDEMSDGPRTSEESELLEPSSSTRRHPDRPEEAVR